MPEFSEPVGDRRIRQQIAVELAGGVGTTETYGTRGACFLTDVQVVAGEPLSFTLLLPDPISSVTIRLHCHGKVNSVERRAEQYAVDALIESLWVE
jgi:hypothetical protein